MFGTTIVAIGFFTADRDIRLNRSIVMRRLGGRQTHHEKRPTRRVITNLAGHLQENEATCQVATKPQTVY